MSDAPVSPPLLRLCNEVVVLRERSDRQHKLFEQALAQARDDLIGRFGQFAGDVQHAYQQLRTELTAEKHFLLFSNLRRPALPVDRVEVEPLVVGRQITTATANLLDLRARCGRNRHPSANSSAIAFRADQLEEHAMIRVVSFVEEKRRGRANVEDHKVDFTVVVDIAEGDAATRLQRAVV